MKNNLMGSTIIEAIDDRNLFAPWFSKRWWRADSWANWRVFLKSLYGLPMSADEFTLYQRFTGRSTAPTEPFTKAWLVCGRRSGKSRVSALIATYNSTFRKYPELQRGEAGVMPIIASDRHQADVIFSYVANFFHEIPLLQKLVVREMKDSLELANGIRIEIQTSDHRSVRGFTMIGGICDELAFWPSDEHSTSADTEILNALEKGSANIPGAMLVGVSSPYAQQGALWDAYQRNFGKDTDELCWQASTALMNPTISARLIEKAYAKDPAAASAEFGASFREDLANFLTYEAINACVAAGRFELAPEGRLSYVGFVDTSGAVGDAMTLAIAHLEGGVSVLDLLREIRPPFSPEAAVKEFCADLKRYRCFEVTGDRYAGEWPRERFAVNGVRYAVSERSRSELYLDFLPMLNSRAVRLLDVSRLKAQLAGLVRRARSGGKDSVDHKPGQHDDAANVVAGVLVLSAQAGGAFGLIEFFKEAAAGKHATIFDGTQPTPWPSPPSAPSAEVRPCPACGGELRPAPNESVDMFRCTSCGRGLSVSRAFPPTTGPTRGAHLADNPGSGSMGPGQRSRFEWQPFRWRR